MMPCLSCQITCRLLLYMMWGCLHIGIDVSLGISSLIVDSCLEEQQLEGPRSAAELVSILQRVVEEQGAVLVASRVEEEERQLNRRLREEQDAAFQAGLQADQVS